MKRRDLFGLVACAWAGAALAAPAKTPSQPSALDAAGQLRALPLDGPADGFAWQGVAEGLQFRVGGLTKSVLFYGPGLVRVAAHLGQAHTAQPRRRREAAAARLRRAGRQRPAHADRRRPARDGGQAQRRAGQAEQARTVTYQGQALTLNLDPASKKP